MEQVIARQSFLDGCKSGVPIAIGYGTIGIAFGVLAKSVGIPNEVSILMSIAVFAGSSQFMAINMLASGTWIFEIIITTFILNLRHFLMTASLGQKIEKLSIPWRFLISFGVTDETFMVASLKEDKVISKYFVLGLYFFAYLFWNVGTWIGVFLASSLPTSIQESMGIALYAMFIGFLVPAIRASRKVFAVVLVAIAVQLLLTYLEWFSSGWRIIFATISGASMGAMFFSEEYSDE